MDVSASSDDVFEIRSRQGTPRKGAIVGIDAASECISQYVEVVERRIEEACPICLVSLTQAPDISSANIVVSLVRCRHCMHLDCLNELLSTQPNARQVSSARYLSG